MRKCVTVSICNEGEDPAMGVVHRQWFDLKTNGPAQHLYDAVCRTNDTLRKRVRELELERQQFMEAYDNLSSALITLEENYKKRGEELATVNRERVQAQDKLRKIDDIISPF